MSQIGTPSRTRKAEPAMSVEENIAVVRRHLDTLSQGDIAASAACFAADTLNHGRLAPPEVMRRVLSSLHTLQERHTIEDIVAVGDTVVCRTTCHGVHAGTPELPVNGGILQGVPPTGGEYTVQHIHIFAVRDGKIAAHWANRDDLGMAQQLGFTIAPPR